MIGAIAAKRQNSWGILVVLYIFLAGLGAGLFVSSFVLNMLDKYSEAARVGTLVGPLLVALGSLMLLFDLGSWTRVYRLFTTPATLVSSWMIRGAWILTAFIIFGLAYSLPAFGAFQWLPWSSATGAINVIGIVAGLLALLVLVYPGMLLGVIKSVPLWNTSALPPLFFLSGLDTGLAALGLITLGFPSIGLDAFHFFGAGGIVLIVLLFVSLAAYLEIVRQTGVTAALSVHLLKNPIFIGGVIILGMLIPLGLLSISAAISDLATVRALEGITDALILIGGVLLRYSVVTSGVRIPAGT